MGTVFYLYRKFNRGVGLGIFLSSGEILDIGIRFSDARCDSRQYARLVRRNDFNAHIEHPVADIVP